MIAINNNIYKEQKIFDEMHNINFQHKCFYLSMGTYFVLLHSYFAIMKGDKNTLLKTLNKFCENTLMETLNIEFIDINEDGVIAKMPVTSKVHQPNGVLHGGASVALAESVGSAGTVMLTNNKNVQVRGIEIAANHVKSVKDGYVYAHGKMIHKGKTIQLWHIDILNEANELISFIKLTTITLHT